MDDQNIRTIPNGADVILLAGNNLSIDLDDDVGKGVAEPFQQSSDGQTLLPFDLVAVVDADHSPWFPMSDTLRSLKRIMFCCFWFTAIPLK